MLKITFITVGSLSEKYWKEACDEYKKRIGGFAEVCELQLKEEKLSQNPSNSEILKALQVEGEAIKSKIPKRAFVIPLCIEGKLCSSEKLAETVERAETDGYNNLCFIIGSSFGLSESVKKLGNIRLSMSPLTFPHQLARVMLYEAVYRSLSIIGGKKYHK